MDALERAFQKHGERLAAMIMVPYDWGEVSEAFVQRARELTEEVGAVLIFDQVLTGFRLARGGAQEYFGVIPDLTTYAKAIANGYPLAAYGGRRDIMGKLYDVTLTSTYAGEALSLAAAEAALTIHRDEPVNEHIWTMGRRLTEGFDRIATELGLEARSFGLPPAPRFRFSATPERDASARHVFFRELFKRGVFPHEPMLVSYAHKEEDVEETLQAFQEALHVVKSDLGS
jgi:glutamate-1-semialdehyde aminotransferase